MRSRRIGDHVHTNTCSHAHRPGASGDGADHAPNAWSAEGVRRCPSIERSSFWPSNARRLTRGHQGCAIGGSGSDAVSASRLRGMSDGGTPEGEKGAALQLPAGTPAGWYADPLGVGAARYWDGTRWSNRHRDAPGPDPVPSPQPQSTLPPPPNPAPTSPKPSSSLRERWKRLPKGAKIGIWVVIALVLIGIANSGGKSGSSSTSTSSSAAPAAKSSTTTHGEAGDALRAEVREGSPNLDQRTRHRRETCCREHRSSGDFGR